MLGWPSTRCPYPLSIGKVTCGDWASSVPDLLVAEGRIGVALGEDLVDARAEFRGGVVRPPAPTSGCATTRRSSRGPAGSSAAAGTGHHQDDWALHDLVATAHADATHRGRRRASGRRTAATSRGWPPTPACRRCWSRLRPWRRPVMHGPDESVPVSELVAVTETLVPTPGPRLPLDAGPGRVGAS